MTPTRHVLIAGGGGVLGHAIAREFANAGCAVSVLRRSLGGTTAHDVHVMACDLLDSAALRAAIVQAQADRGAVDVLVCNAAHLAIAPVAELSADDFDMSLRVGVGVAFHAVQAVIGAMLARGSGTILFTGATASTRGSARFAALAAAKFALRGFAQALARELQPHGVHVSHVVLDGLLRGSHSVQRFGGNDSRTIDAADAARTFRWLAEQNHSAWTHELDLRPQGERF
jgi:NAD(P)-dependent dehydrogenase (short-subunit alcohol dehydrogenase family)